MLPPFGGALTGGGGTASAFKLAIGAGLLSMGLNSDVNHKDQMAVVALVAGTAGLVAAVPAASHLARTILAQRSIPRPKPFHPKPTRLVERQPKPKHRPSRTEHVYTQPTKTQSSHSRGKQGNKSALYGAALIGVVVSFVFTLTAHDRNDVIDLDLEDTLDDLEDMVTSDQQQDTNQQLVTNENNNNDNDFQILFYLLAFFSAIKKASDSVHNEQQSLLSRSVTTDEVVHNKNNDNHFGSLVLAFFSAIEQAGYGEEHARSVEVVWNLGILDIMDATLQLAALNTPPGYFMDYSNKTLDIPLPLELVEPNAIYLPDFLLMFCVTANTNIHSYIVGGVFPFSEWVQANAISCRMCTNPLIDTYIYELWKLRRAQDLADEDYVDCGDSDYSDSKYDRYTYQDNINNDTYEDAQSDNYLEQASEDGNVLVEAIEDVVEGDLIDVIKEVVEEYTNSASAPVSPFPTNQERVEEQITASVPLTMLSVEDEVDGIKPEEEQVATSLPHMLSNKKKRHRSGRRSHVRAKGRSRRAASDDVAGSSKHI